MPFKKGISGNPSGRPKVPMGAVEATALARQYTKEAIETLVDVMRTATSAATRLSAAMALLDRAWGKSPVMEPEVDKTLEVVIDDRKKAA